MAEVLKKMNQNVSVSVNRKSFLAGLGVAGLGLAAGMTRGATSAMAQEEGEGDAAAPSDTVVFLEDPMQKRVELYNAFTAALAAELSIGSADEVDGAIRIAIMNVIDGQVGDDGLTAGQAEALKALVATSDVPVGPMMFGHGPGGPGEFGIGMAHGPMGPGRGRFKMRVHDGERPDGEWDREDSRPATESDVESDTEADAGS